MANFSFDIASEYNLAEVINALDQTKREIQNRYDFKGTSAGIDFLNADRGGVKVVGDTDYHLDAVLDIFRKKLSTRGVSQKILDTSKDPVVSNLKTSKEVPFKKGLDQEKAKKITALLRAELPKVKTQIQGEEVRVTSGKKDELQAAMRLIESQDYDFPVIFTNFR